MFPKRQDRLDRAIKEKKEAIKAVEELLKDDKFVNAVEKTNEYRASIMRNMSKMSASDVSKYAMEIYAVFAEIGVLERILGYCGLPVTKVEEKGNGEEDE